MIPDFVTKARFQSGLEDSQSMAEELRPSSLITSSSRFSRPLPFL